MTKQICNKKQITCFWYSFMSDSNPVVSDTVLCWLQIALNLSRTPCLEYKTFLLDTSIQIQTFNYDCNYLVLTALST